MRLSQTLIVALLLHLFFIGCQKDDSQPSPPSNSNDYIKDFPELPELPHNHFIIQIDPEGNNFPLNAFEHNNSIALSLNTNHNLNYLSVESDGTYTLNQKTDKAHFLNHVFFATSNDQFISIHEYEVLRPNMYPVKAAILNSQFKSIDYTWYTKNSRDNPISSINAFTDTDSLYIFTTFGNKQGEYSVQKNTMYLPFSDFQGSKLTTLPTDLEVNNVISAGNRDIIVHGKRIALSQDFTLLKMNLEGAIDWSISHDFYSDTKTHLNPTSDGYLIVGNSENNIHLLKTDFDGNLAWRKTINVSIDKSITTNDVLLTRDNKIKIVSTSKSKHQSFQIYLHTLDNVGNLLNEEEFGGPNSEYATKIIELDQYYFIIGLTRSYSYSASATYLIRLDK